MLSDYLHPKVMFEELWRDDVYLVCTGPYKMLKKLHKTLTARSNKDVVLIANAMFSQMGFPMEETFMTTNKANFQCESRNLDFSNPHTAAEEINGWVNNKTRGRGYGWMSLCCTQS